MTFKPRTMWISVLWFCAVVQMPTLSQADDLILVVGAGGTEEYATLFSEWAEQWKQTAELSKWNYHAVNASESESYPRLQELIEQQTTVDDDSPLWLVLLGHGTYDRKIAKFNLRGKDVEAQELAGWLQPCKRPLVLVNAFSCSGAFLAPLQAPGRVVITATKSGAELNFSRLGGYLSQSLQDLDADLDHDDQVSLLEAFLLACSQVKLFYESDSRLMTEHALLEDNHDGKGTSADFFRGIRPTGAAKNGLALDGMVAHRFIVKSSPDAVQLDANASAQRDQIEAEIEKLRGQKSALVEDDYYERLEPWLVKMAKLYAVPSETMEAEAAQVSDDAIEEVQAEEVPTEDVQSEATQS